ncbi:hypothetical protein GO013_15640 [Pseudodesulfovibrio sp. JC047]|uniref:helix-turn-helix domain-containing protein n=1 Tax=Pseudodesulfovibrio sp. JC047 TaxID=2683199 RepID=UPI0013D837B4|nr:helix-turn-helix domain-containing protein [Pseudodesulfovibrio sp. JC047]NDV20843.1 hypothetical protein [Pseudodesulfovibrio sp. JC047]
MSEAKRHRLEELERETPHLRTAAEIAAYMRMDEKTVNGLINSGDLKIRKVAGTYRATKPQLDRYIEDVHEF